MDRSRATGSILASLLIIGASLFPGIPANADEAPQAALSGVLYVAHGVVFDQSFIPIGTTAEVADLVDRSDLPSKGELSAGLRTYSARHGESSPEASSFDEVGSSDEGASFRGTAGIDCGGKKETFVLGEWNRAPWPATGIRSGHSALRCGKSNPGGGGWSHFWVDGHRADFARIVASSGGPTDDLNMRAFLRSFVISQTLEWPDNVVSLDRTNSFQYSTYLELYDTRTGSMRSFTAYVAVGRSTENVVTAWPSGAIGD